MTTPQSNFGQAVGQTLVFDARQRAQLFRRKGLLLWAAVWLLMPVGEAKQGASPNQPLGAGPSTGRTDPTAPGQRDSMGLHVEHQMAERRNDERQKQLVADTEKLLSLAQSLKEEVDKSNKDELSIDVVKRAEQIEKLAKSVKDKMKGY